MGWIISRLSLGNSSDNLFITSYTPWEFDFLSLWNSYLFPLIICIISTYIVIWAWCHTHILSIHVKLHHRHWVIILTSWNISMSITIFCSSGRSWLSHDPSQLQSQLQKSIWLTYLKIAMCKPRPSLVNQVLLCSFEHSYLYNSSENIPLLRHP